MALALRLFAFLFLAILIAGRPVAAGELRVGRAAVDITPPPGTPMLTPQRPPFTVKLADAAHDPIQVKAVVLEMDGRRAAAVVCDLTSLPVRMIDSFRRQVFAATGIDPEAVMISATHTHTAPQIRSRFLGNVPPEARRLADDYIAALPGHVTEAVRRAVLDLSPATVSAATGREDTLSFNRRYVLGDGRVETNPFKDEPARLAEIIRPAGPIDPDVHLVCFHSPDGVPRIAMVNFAIHLDTIGGTRPSADFPFLLDRLLGAVEGEQMLTVFSTGAAGNINHYDLRDPARPWRRKDAGEATRIGTILSAAVLKTSRQLVPLAAGELRWAQEVVRLDMPTTKGAALATRHGNAARFFDGEVDIFHGDGRQQFDANVQVIALGDELAWVGFPGEMFVELGLSLKQQSPFRYTIVHTLANGSIGYVPDRKGHAEGGYEAIASRCAPGSGERLVEVALELLHELKDE